MKADHVRRAAAFAPGHITGVFAPRTDARDPRRRGSVGAGVVLELGVRALAVHRPAGPRRLRLTGDVTEPLGISLEVARRLTATVPGSVTVHLRHDLPIGQGFGTSAAGATATALALSRLVGHPRADALATAHLAELFGGGGLGGVAAILGGGIELRVRPGVPPWGEVRHAPFLSPLLVWVVGDPMPSPAVLSDSGRLRRIAEACSGWERLIADPSPATFFAVSERFTDRVGLAGPRLRAVLRGLRRTNTRAVQAMFGGSFVALPEGPAARRAAVAWLARVGVRAVEVRPARRGARVLGPVAAARSPQAF